MEKEKLIQITRRERIAEDEFYPMIRTIYEQIWQNLLPPQIPTDGLATKRANNVLTPADAPVPDCVTCGACCVAFPCVGVRPEEEVPAEYYWEITKTGADGGEVAVDRFLRRDGETLYCASLAVDGGNVVCLIYERRPRMCRDFEAGSDKCRALRRAFGFEPFLSLEEMSEAQRRLANRPKKIAPEDVIREAKFSESEEGAWQIFAYMKDGAVNVIHAFDPKEETWRQFEFDGLTLAEARRLIASRRK